MNAERVRVTGAYVNRVYPDLLALHLSDVRYRSLQAGVAGFHARCDFLAGFALVAVLYAPSPGLNLGAILWMTQFAPLSAPAAWISSSTGWLVQFRDSCYTGLRPHGFSGRSCKRGQLFSLMAGNG